MTAPGTTSGQPHTDHCGHECNGEVCSGYQASIASGLTLIDGPCLVSYCKHDTRQRKIPEGEPAYIITEELHNRILGTLLIGAGFAPDNLAHQMVDISDTLKELHPLSDMAETQPQEPVDCKKYLQYRADSGHLYHLLHDLLGKDIDEEGLSDALSDVLDNFVRAQPQDAGKDQESKYTFGYFSRHKYKDLVFYVVNDDGQTNTGLFEMPDTEENRKLMNALKGEKS